MAPDVAHMQNVERWLPANLLAAMKHAPLPDSGKWTGMVTKPGHEFDTAKIAEGYSPNQEAMLAALWLYEQPDSGRDEAFWIVSEETAGRATFHRKEPLSNTYQSWKVASVIAMYGWAIDNGDHDFADVCRRWLRATWAFNTLGAAPSADRIWQKGPFRWRYEGPWVPSAGMRSTPQHYNTSTMGLLLAEALDLTANDRSGDWTAKVLERGHPLGLSGDEAAALRRILGGIEGPGAALDMLKGFTFCEPFHFTRWRSAVCTWHDKNVNGNTADVKASLWERVNGVGEATHLYPYSDPGERNPSVGSCENVGGILTAKAETVDHLTLPEDSPIYDVTVGA